MLDKKNIIFLWGMPGSGKTNLGKKLAHYLDYAFVDLDDFIEISTQKTIEEIFRDWGEDRFRKIENELLMESIVEMDAPRVISIGGGTPFYYDNFKNMSSNGITIYLEVPLPILIARVSTNDKRPLLKLNPQEAMEELYEQRKSTYQQADITIGHLPDQWQNLRKRVGELYKK